MLSIRIPNASAEGFTATVRRNATVNKAALRTLILNMAADALGCSMKQMAEKGYDVAAMKDGWEVETTEETGRYRLNTYTVRPLTERERAEKLHREGGTTPNADGSLSFWLPGEYPLPKSVPVKMRHQR